MPRRKGKHQEVERDDVYVIKSIRDYDKRDGVDYYLIEWEGYPLDEATWEPRSNIVDPQQEIMDRMKELKAGKQDTQPSGGVSPGRKSRTSANETPASSSKPSALTAKRKGSSIGEADGIKKRKTRESLRKEGDYTMVITEPGEAHLESDSEKSGSRRLSTAKNIQSPLTVERQSKTINKPKKGRFKVKAIKKNDQEQLQVTILNEDCDEKTTLSMKQCRESYPQELIDFLISRIQFREPSRYDFP